MKKHSILIVDDEALNITALSHMLGDDYNVHVTKSGLEGYEAAKEMLPDIILLDIVMPEMNGYDVIEALKKDDNTKDIPVIFVTARGHVQDEELGLALGAVDYIAKPFSASIVKKRVANQLKILSQMRTINELSRTDALTGIGNRRHFNDILDKEWSRAMRQQKPLGFIIIDIDHFKTYNDNYGHLQGDIVLVKIAEIIKNGLHRAIDQVARWGGEEFAIILPDTDSDGAVAVVENIRKTVEETAFMLNGKPTHVTISAGVHSVIPSQNSDYKLDNFVSHADTALYHAKNKGRNRTSTLEDV